MWANLTACTGQIKQTDPTAIVTNGCIFEPKSGFNFALYDPESCTRAGAIRITNFTMPVKLVLRILLFPWQNLWLFEHSVGFNTAYSL